MPPTKEEHDAIVAARGRNLTDRPIQPRKVDLPQPTGFSVIDAYLPPPQD